MLTNFLKRNSVAKLSNKEQQEIQGGFPIPYFDGCAIVAYAHTYEDSQAAGGYDEITWSTVYQEHYSECVYN